MRSKFSLPLYMCVRLPASFSRPDPLVFCALDIKFHAFEMMPDASCAFSLCLSVFLSLYLLCCALPVRVTSGAFPLSLSFCVRIYRHHLHDHFEGGKKQRITISNFFFFLLFASSFFLCLAHVMLLFPLL